MKTQDGKSILIDIENEGWKFTCNNHLLDLETGLYFGKKNSFVVFLGLNKFSLWAQWAEVGLSNAGTATEQLVGLGIPCVSLPGRGPQFNWSFARTPN